MGYELVSAPGGFFVETKASGAHHSSLPMPLQKAKAQMRAISMSEHSSHKSRPTKEKWIQKVTESPEFKKGAFTKEAVQHHMTAGQFKEEVLAHPEKYSITTRRRAQFIHNIGV